MAAAADSFDTRGYAGTTFNILMGTGGLTKGAIHYHFPSKEAVAVQLIDDWIAFVFQSHSAAAKTGRSALEQIVDIFRSLADHIAVDTALCAGMKLTIENSIDIAHQAFSCWVEAVDDLVVAAVNADEIRDAPTARRLARNLCASIVGVTHASTQRPEPLWLAAYIDDILAAYLGRDAPHGRCI